MAGCERCGAEFEPVKWNQRFCSPECGKRARYEGRRHPECHCWQCGEAFHPKAKDRTKFCSRECAYAYRKVHAKPPEIVDWPKCVVCGKPCSRMSAKTCSGECRNELTRRQNRESNAAQKPITQHVCKECGRAFTPEYGNKHRAFCSVQCSVRHGRRISKGVREARKRGNGYEPVNPIRVFERAGWRCYLCGRETPRALRGTCESNAPEVDHIVPIAKGGRHTYANTACACRACNQTKSDSLLVQSAMGIWPSRTL